MNKLTIEDWESSEMDRISNNVTQDYGHELEKIAHMEWKPPYYRDQIHEVLAMIKEDHYVYEKKIDYLNKLINELSKEVNNLKIHFGVKKHY